MAQEVTLLSEILEKPIAEKIGEFEFLTGTIEGHDVILLRCGIGKVNAAVGCALMVRVFGPDFVVNTGSAGGIGEGLRFGDVIVSTGLLYHDVDLTAFDYAPGQLPGRSSRIFSTDGGLVATARKALGELKAEGILPADIGFREGIIGTGDTFMHREPDIAKLRGQFPEVAAVEMEGAAIAHCCALLSVPALVIRSLSDIAGEESAVTFEEFLPVASRHSAEIVRRIVKNS